MGRAELLDCDDRAIGDGWRAIFAVNVVLAALVYGILRVTTSVEAAAVKPAGLLGDVRVTPPLVASLVMNALVSGVMVSTLILAPFVLSRTFGLSLHDVGIAMALGPLTTTLAAIPSGRFADRLNGRLVALAGLVLFTFGAFCLATLRTDLGLAGYLVPIVLLGFGYGIFQTSNNTMIVRESPAAARRDLGLARPLAQCGPRKRSGALFGAVTHGNAESGEVVATAVRTAFVGATAMGPWRSRWRSSSAWPDAANRRLRPAVSSAPYFSA
jgi:MFS family permease